MVHLAVIPYAALADALHADPDRVRLAPSPGVAPTRRDCLLVNVISDVGFTVGVFSRRTKLAVGGEPLGIRRLVPLEDPIVLPTIGIHGHVGLTG